MSEKLGISSSEFINFHFCHLDTLNEGEGDLQLLQSRSGVGGRGWEDAIGFREKN